MQRWRMMQRFVPETILYNKLAVLLKSDSDFYLVVMCNARVRWNLGVYWGTPETHYNLLCYNTNSYIMCSRHRSKIQLLCRKWPLVIWHSLIWLQGRYYYKFVVYVLLQTYIYIYIHIYIYVVRSSQPLSSVSLARQKPRVAERWRTCGATPVPFLWRSVNCIQICFWLVTFASFLHLMVEEILCNVTLCRDLLYKLELLQKQRILKY